MESDDSQPDESLTVDPDEDFNEPFEKPEFDPDEWELVEEDDCLVELHGITKKNFLSTCDRDRVKLIGLFDPKGETFLQLDQYIFAGGPAETFGTNVIFEEIHQEDSSGDEEDTFKNNSPEQHSNNVKLKYHSKTEQKLSLYRALLMNKTASSDSGS